MSYETQSSFDRSLYNRSKMQFYPTNVREVKKISNLFNFDMSEEICLLEPCMGAGDAIKEFTNLEREKIKIFGVELNEDLYQKSKEFVDFGIQGDFTSIRCSSKVFSICFCNPPYGEVVGDKKQRIERSFLTNITRYMKSDGIIIWIIPYYLFDKDKTHAKAFTNRYDVLAIYKFEQKEFAKYKQVLIIGKRKKTNITNKNAAMDLYQRAFVDIDKLDIIPAAVNKEDQFIVPDSYEEHVRVFASSKFNYSEALEHLHLSGNYHKLRMDTMVDPFGSIKERPPLMPNSSQLFTLVSVGRTEVVELDGFVQRGVLKDYSETFVEEDGGKVSEVTKRYSKASIVLVTSNGDISRIDK